MFQGNLDLYPMGCVLLYVSLQGEDQKQDNEKDTMEEELSQARNRGYIDDVYLSKLK